MTTAAKTRTDEEIQRDVLDEFKWEARLQPNEIGVVVKDGVVTLTGWVDSYIKKWTAERAALRVNGVHAVANDLEVRLTPGDQRTDADIAAAATRALQWDAAAPNDTVKVTVSKGWVTLEGDAEWQFQRDSAERAVRALAGVRGVINLIRVRPRIRPSPDELERKISEALVRNAETDASRIRVEVAGDRVVLSGMVRSWAERQEAERSAWSAPALRASRITLSSRLDPRADMTECVAPVIHHHDEAPRLSVDWFALGPVVYFDATGEIDACVADILRTALAAALERPCVREIVVDLGSLWFLDAGGAGAFIDARRSAEQRNIWMHVVGAHGTPRLVLEILGVYELLRAPERRERGGNAAGSG